MHLTTELTRNNEPEWLPMSAWTGQLANEWSGRSDIVAYVDSTASVDTAGVAALFDPIRAEVEVNTKIAFGPLATPEMVGDIRKNAVQFDYPIATGAIFHEAMHARFTKWNLRDALEALSENEYKAFHLLEEGRIERLGIDALPDSATSSAPLPLALPLVTSTLRTWRARLFDSSRRRWLSYWLALTLAYWTRLTRRTSALSQ